MVPLARPQPRRSGYRERTWRTLRNTLRHSYSRAEVNNMHYVPRKIRWHDFLLLICILLTVASVGCVVNEHVSAEEDVREQGSLASGGSLTVENGRGDLRLVGSDTTEVQVEAHKFFEGSEFDRERWMRETKIRIEGDDHHRYVKVDYPEMHFGWGFWNGNRAVNLTVRVPREVNAILKDGRGHLNISNIEGRLEIASTRSDAEIEGFAGELRVRGSRGDLKVRDSSIHGGVRVSLERGSAEIRLKQFAGDSDLEVSRGNITLTIPENSVFTLDAERSRRSSFHTDFSVLARGGFKDGDIRGDVNGGGPILRLRAERGSVWLRAGMQ